MNGAVFFVSCYHIILFVTWLIVAVLRITAQYFGHYVLHPCAHNQLRCAWLRLHNAASHAHSYIQAYWP